MAENTYAYPFDPTGEKSDNLIVNERHIINPPDYMDYYFVVPFVGPFFENNLKVIHWSGGVAKELVNGVDFVLGYPFVGASRATAKAVYGAISIYGRSISGTIEITYQTLGGRWTIDQAKAAEMLSNAKTNPRITTWEEIMDSPETFPVIDHEWNLDDLVGASEVVEELSNIEKAILQAREESEGGGVSHINDRDNPHQVTKDQVGLDSVQNYPIASVAEARDGDSNTRYMTPRRVSEAIDEFVGNQLRDHVNDTNNPHQVTKDQIGLSQVENLPLATVEIARAGTSSTHYLTPEGASALLGDQIDERISGHVDDTNNPHSVNKEQVGLGNVPNWDPASDQQALEGSSRNLFVSPFQVSSMISEIALSQLAGHTSNFNNPHQVTKDQIGLDQVENFSIASEDDAREATRNNLYMTPRRVREAINSLVGSVLSDHMADSNNPHNVTKSQIGLGSVENFGIASEVEAIQGTAVNRYMTPATTKAVLDTFVSEGVGSHVNSTDNPHGVNKSQIGLGEVDNYRTASTTEAREGNVTNRFMTPALVKSAIEFIAIEALSTHASDYNNPHQVSKTQVGLGNVENYSIATQQEAIAGTSNDKYMTPQRVSQHVSNSTDPIRLDLSNHIEDQNNPHQVTKDQVGLDQVENYPVASVGDIRNRSNEHYLTPANVSTVVDEYVEPRLLSVEGDMSTLSTTLITSFEEATWLISGKNIPSLSPYTLTEDYLITDSTRTLSGWLLAGENGTMLSLIDGVISEVAIPITTDITWLESNNDIVIAATVGGTLYRSTNGGNNWTTMSLGYEQSESPLDIRQSGSSWIVLFRDYIFISNNNGSSWTRVALPSDGNASSSIRNDSVLVACLEELISIELATQNITIVDLGIDQISTAEYMSDGGLIVSVQNTVYNIDKSTEYEVDDAIVRMVQSGPDGLIYLTTAANDVYRSLTDGKTWYRQPMSTQGFNPKVSYGNDQWVITNSTSDIMLATDLQ